MIVHVLVAVSDDSLAKRIRRALGSHSDVIVEAFDDEPPLWRAVTSSAADFVVIDRASIPEPSSDIVRGVRESPDSPEFVILAHEPAPDDVARLLASGCMAVLDDSLAMSTLVDALVSLIQRCRHLVIEGLSDGSIGQQPVESPRLSDFVSHSQAMKTFMSFVERVAASDASLLLLGETGVGKEHLARAIHSASPRSLGPFVAVNCAAFPESLLESELFGHEVGAFTSATRSRKGWFELAHRGTIMLDEIGELPTHLQVKLLRVLQEREVRPLGSEGTVSVDVRVMAATNRNLEQEIAERRFREDLYFRLNVVSLIIPPLRERREDIPAMLRQYLDVFRVKLRRSVRSISKDAMKALTTYGWPGNLRELINILERAVLLCPGKQLELTDFPELSGGSWPTVAQSVDADSKREVESFILPDDWVDRPWLETQRAVLRMLEEHYIAAILRKSRGRVGDAARLAGLDPRTVYSKMRKIGLRKEQFKVKDERD